MNENIYLILYLQNIPSEYYNLRTLEKMGLRKQKENILRHQT